MPRLLVFALCLVAPFSSFAQTPADKPNILLIITGGSKAKANDDSATPWQLYDMATEWSTLKLGTVKLPQGPARLTLEALSMPGTQVMDLKHVQLTLR
ncbi:hypothetical protein [Prosthecobacter sp.]|uniref:hypothetical protein n=1 Tax=Prosthecobacter sp. TaxID=1965333 RepID=UPI002489EBCF|nr:hypothetical protein [Prosthecobacter sp.]MDI1312977.1 hypothetical protein [Prosthecobacter sp.]